MQHKFSAIVKALESSPNYDQALKYLSDIRETLNAFTSIKDREYIRRPKSRVYTKNEQEKVINKIMQYSGKAIHEVLDPKITKREAIAIADYIKNIGNA